MKKKKINKRNLISLILIILFSITLLFSLYKIIKWNIDNNNTKKIMSKIDNNITKEVNDSDKTEIINNNEELSKSDPYWDYIKMNMIDVKFDDLKKINKDVVGWIKVNGTNINYPFVQTSNNDYYLNHSFDKSSNGGGWVFLDYRNNKTNNKNTIIYGHGRQNKTIFGTLKNILNNGWLENKDNYIIKISTEKEKINTLYHKVSQYVKSKNKNNNIFIIHRLDRDTSGVVMFAKSEKIKKLYQNDLNTTSYCSNTKFNIFMWRSRNDI